MGDPTTKVVIWSCTEKGFLKRGGDFDPDLSRARVFTHMGHVKNHLNVHPKKYPDNRKLVAYNLHLGLGKATLLYNIDGE